MENNDTNPKFSKFVKLFDLFIRIACIITTLTCIVLLCWMYERVSVIRQLESARTENRGSFDNIYAMMQEINNLYDENFIGEEVQDATLEDAALYGFALGFGDKYGYYASPKMTEEIVGTQKERLVGIGIEAVYEEGKGYYVADIYENSPAQQAGIDIGDYLTTVDGQDISDTGRDKFLEILRGEEGTLVNVGIQKESSYIEKEIMRKNIRANSVSLRINEDSHLAYIKIKSFTEYTDEEFNIVLDEIEKAEIKDVVIDLRDNYGGMAETVISMLDTLLPEGMIVRFESKNGKDNRVYDSDKSSKDLNIAIIVNGTTASASELFSQCLQDYNKAIIVGTQTYGKGTVLSTYTLSNGGTITMSTAKYYTVSGSEIEGNGVTPDIIVDMAPEKRINKYKLPLEEDDQVLAAIEALQNK